jgi:nitric oxide reductase NorQ protein
MTTHELKIEEFRITEEPYYLPIRDEIEVFRAAFRSQIPVILKGPTGTGKTRFVEYMAYVLGREGEAPDANGKESLPLITVACH